MHIMQLRRLKLILVKNGKKKLDPVFQSIESASGHFFQRVEKNILATTNRTLVRSRSVLEQGRCLLDHTY